MSAVDWDDLRFLLALHEAGSLAAAARSLKVDGSTVSRRLSSLECALGAKLFARTPDGLKLNEIGERAVMTAREMNGLARSLEATVAGADQAARGVVRVAVTEGFAPILYPGLADLRASHPDLHVEIVVSSERADLSRGDADVAIRLFRETSGDLVVRKAATIGWSLYASRAYIARRGAPTVETIGEHDVVGFEGAAARSPGHRWLEEHGAKRIVVRAPGVSAAKTAVVSGMGAAVLPCFIASDDEALERLVPEVLAENEAFLVAPTATKDVARVRIVLDALRARLAEQAPFLSGRV